MQPIPATPAKRIVVAISGASGAVYGVRLLQALASLDHVESHLTVSSAGFLNLQQELEMSRADVEALADVVYCWLPSQRYESPRTHPFRMLCCTHLCSSAGSRFCPRQTSGFRHSTANRFHPPPGSRARHTDRPPDRTDACTVCQLG